MRKVMILMASVLLAGGAALFAAPAGAQSGDASVVVIHGVPDTPVDVYVNGKATLTNFAPDTVTDPLSLPAGDYTIDVRAAGAAATAAPVISGKVTLPAGANATLVAHLDASGKPVLTPFVNDPPLRPPAGLRDRPAHGRRPGGRRVRRRPEGHHGAHQPEVVRAAERPGRHHLGQGHGLGLDQRRDRPRRCPGDRRHVHRRLRRRFPAGRQPARPDPDPRHRRHGHAGGVNTGNSGLAAEDSGPSTALLVGIAAVALAAAGTASLTLARRRG